MFFLGGGGWRKWFSRLRRRKKKAGSGGSKRRKKIETRASKRKEKRQFQPVPFLPLSLLLPILTLIARAARPEAKATAARRSAALDEPPFCFLPPVFE